MVDKFQTRTLFFALVSPIVFITKYAENRINFLNKNLLGKKVLRRSAIFLSLFLRFRIFAFSLWNISFKMSKVTNILIQIPYVKVQSTSLSNTFAWIWKCDQVHIYVWSPWVKCRLHINVMRVSTIVFFYPICWMPRIIECNQIN